MGKIDYVGLQVRAQAVAAAVRQESVTAEAVGTLLYDLASAAQRVEERVGSMERSKSDATEVDGALAAIETRLDDHEEDAARERERVDAALKGVVLSVQRVEATKAETAAVEELQQRVEQIDQMLIDEDYGLGALESATNDLGKQIDALDKRKADSSGVHALLTRSANTDDALQALSTRVGKEAALLRGLVRGGVTYKPLHRKLELSLGDETRGEVLLPVADTSMSGLLDHHTLQKLANNERALSFATYGRLPRIRQATVAELHGLVLVDNRGIAPYIGGRVAGGAATEHVGRNYALGTADNWIDEKTITYPKGAVRGYTLSPDFWKKVRAGERDIVLSADIGVGRIVKSPSTAANIYPNINILLRFVYADGTHQGASINANHLLWPNKEGTVPLQRRHAKVALKDVPERADYCHFIFTNGDYEDVQARNLKVEFGTEPTEWMPAPEDVEEAYMKRRANLHLVYLTVPEGAKCLTHGVEGDDLRALDKTVAEPVPSEWVGKKVVVLYDSLNAVAYLNWTGGDLFAASSAIIKPDCICPKVGTRFLEVVRATAEHDIDSYQVVEAQLDGGVKPMVLY